MDQALLDIMESGDRRHPAVQVKDLLQGQIEVIAKSGSTAYTLKPLRDLYGKGPGVGSVSPRDERYEPLFMAIEKAVAEYDHTVPRLKDGIVQLTLERMGMDPAAECGQDELCRHLQAVLRLFLSINDYSRQEVKTAFRTIARSVERHKVVEGPRGYLDFIHEFLG